MTVTIDGQLGITTPSLTATVVNADEFNLSGPFNFTGNFTVDGSLILTNTTNNFKITLNSGVNLANWTMTLPTGPGASGQFLSTDGSGNTAWIAGGAGTVNTGSQNEISFYAANGDAVSGNPFATISNGYLTLGFPGSAAGGVILSGATSQNVTIYAPANAGNWSLTLPDNAGAAGQGLITDGAGNTSWTTLATGIVNAGTANQLSYYAASGDTVSGNANANITNGSLYLGSIGAVAGELSLYGGTSGTIKINTPTVAGTWTLTLPDNNGTNGQALVTDGNGVTSWAAVGGSGTVNNGNLGELAYYSATGIVVSGNGNVRASAGGLTLGVAGATAGTLTLSGATSGTVTLATTAAAGNWTFTLPSSDGANGQALVTDGSGNTSWAPVGGSGTVNNGNGDEIAYYSATGTAVSGNSNVRVNTGTMTLGSTGSVAGGLLISGSTSGVVTINTAAAAGTWTLTLPTDDGSNGYVLQTDGSGASSWSAISGTGNVVRATTPTITGLNETKTAPSIAAGTLTIDCSAGNVFSVSLNADITTLTFTNVPTSGTSYALTLYFTADGTGRTITWGASVKWPNNTAPTLTSTNGKVDTFVLNTFDAGTTWYAFTAGQNA